VPWNRDISALKHQVAALKSANAVGDRSLKTEAVSHVLQPSNVGAAIYGRSELASCASESVQRAKSRADAKGSKAQQDAQELNKNNTRLANQLRHIEGQLAAETREHKLCRAQCTEAQHKIKALTNELNSERSTNNSLQVSLKTSANKQAQLDMMLKNVSRQTESLASMGISTRSTSNVAKVGGTAQLRKSTMRKQRHSTNGGHARSSISAVRRQARESVGGGGDPASCSFAESVTERESENDGGRGFDMLEEASSSPLLHPVDGAQGIAYKV
jgi:hypothetical protein